MTHAFQLDGLAHELWLSRSANGYQMHTGDTSVTATLVARGAHVHELTFRDVGERVVIACHGDDVHIHLDGESYLLRYSDGLERFATRPEEGAESVSRAPMPGAVISVAVEPGAAVRRGQALLVIESMKMETTIIATCDGTVQTVHVATGQTFDRDAPLVTLERIKEPT